VTNYRNISNLRDVENYIENLRHRCLLSQLPKGILVHIRRRGRMELVQLREKLDQTLMKKFDQLSVVSWRPIHTQRA
jgi:hypothetical protein